MRNDPIAVQRGWRMAGAAFGVALLMWGSAGCTSVTVNLTTQSQPVSQPATPQPGRYIAPSDGPPSGGNFMPVQAGSAGGGSSKICGNSVSGKYVRFYPPMQTPDAGDTGWRGYLWNVTDGVAIPNTAYYLQWFVTSANTGCCTPVAGSSTHVSCPVTPGLLYGFTAHFKQGQAPPKNTQILLQGAWTQ